MIPGVREIFGKFFLTKEVTKFKRAMIYETIGKKVRPFTIERV